MTTSQCIHNNPIPFKKTLISKRQEYHLNNNYQQKAIFNIIRNRHSRNLSTAASAAEPEIKPNEETYEYQAEVNSFKLFNIKFILNSG